MTADEFKEKGFAQATGVVQVTFEVHPAALVVPLLLNLKVKQPFVAEEVKGPGTVVPQNEPATPPGTVPAGFALAICGDVIEFPL